MVRRLAHSPTVIHKRHHRPVYVVSISPNNRKKEGKKKRKGGCQVLNKGARTYIEIIQEVIDIIVVASSGVVTIDTCHTRAKTCSFLIKDLKIVV